MAEGTETGEREFVFRDGVISWTPPQDAVYCGMRVFDGEGALIVATHPGFSSFEGLCFIRQSEAVDAAVALETMAGYLRSWATEQSPVLCDGISTKEASL